MSSDVCMNFYVSLQPCNLSINVDMERKVILLIDVLNIMLFHFCSSINHEFGCEKSITKFIFIDFTNHSAKST